MARTKLKQLTVEALLNDIAAATYTAPNASYQLKANPDGGWDLVASYEVDCDRYGYQGQSVTLLAGYDKRSADRALAHCTRQRKQHLAADLREREEREQAEEDARQAEIARRRSLPCNCRGRGHVPKAMCNQHGDPSLEICPACQGSLSIPGETRDDGYIVPCHHCGHTGIKDGRGRHAEFERIIAQRAAENEKAAALAA